MTWWIIAAAVFLYAVYTLSAEIVLHICHFGILYRGNPDKRTLALTFDDGPDPNYTPQLLEILHIHQVKATFFVVGARAARYPHLVKQIVDEGHEVGSHSYCHSHAFLRSPLGIYRDLARSKRELEHIAGRQITYYRSPWGAMNWAVVITCKVLNMRHVLWSVRAIDWKAGDYAKDVIYRVVRSAHPGAIVLCHDAGGAKGAPKNTITALPVIITQLRKLGFSFSTIHELDTAKIALKKQSASPYARFPLWRRILIFTWQVVEFSFTKIYHVLTIDAMFRISPSVWRHGVRHNEGSSVSIIKDGTKAIDLHFQNETLISVSSANDNRAPVKILRMVKEGLRNIARVLETHPDYADVQVIMALTLMNRGIEMLGFHVEELPKAKEKKHIESYMRFLLGMYHPEGFKRLRQGSQSLSLKLVWMTRDELIERYGHVTSVVSG